MDMTNAIIELTVLAARPGTSGAKLHGRDTGYIGQEYLCDHDTLTSAIRAFDLENAVAPGEWPTLSAYQQFGAAEKIEEFERFGTGGI